MKTTTEETFNDYPIMTDQQRGLACDTKILTEIEKQFDYAEETKSKVFFMRYDIRFPEGYDHADNGVFRAFQSKFMKNLSRQGVEATVHRSQGTVQRETPALPRGIVT